MKNPKEPTADALLNQAELALDTAALPMEFANLTQMVESVMLTQPIAERTPVHKPTGERAVLQRYGASALRLLLECENDIEEIFTQHEHDLLDIVRQPQRYSQGELPGAAEWAQDFGTALLNEAYTSIGVGVEAKIAEYREATTAEQQIETLQWLDKRLRDIKNLREGDDVLYHPARLSPKLVGAYPDITLPPTCLSYSIMAASFLHRANAPMLHAGVMATRNTLSTYQIAANWLAKSFELAEDHGSTSLSESLCEKAVDARDRLHAANAEGGYHAVVLTQLLDGRWVQIDPNFESTVLLPNEQCDQAVTQAYQRLNDYATIAPLLEQTVAMEHKALPALWAEFIAPKNDTMRHCLAQLEAIFTDDDDESLPRRIIEVLYRYRQSTLDPVAQPTAHEYRTLLDEQVIMVDAQGNHDPFSEKTPYGEEVYDLLYTYILCDQDPGDFKQRCRRDKNYLQRRLVDAEALMSTVFCLEAELMAQYDSYKNTAHAVFEVGRPAQRIAMTVLNEYATAVADGVLPPSFWNGTWPSLVPVTGLSAERYGNEQQTMLRKMAHQTLQRRFTYYRDYGTINSVGDPTNE